MIQDLVLDFSVDLSHREKFEQFHAANPQVYEALEDLAGTLVSKGRSKIGIGFLCEVLRWNYYMNTDDPNSDFKINNNYRPYYARLLIQNNPLWENKFELRTIRS